MIFLSRGERHKLIRGALLGGKRRRNRSWGRSCDNRSARGGIRRHARRRRSHIGGRGPGSWSYDDGRGGHRGQANRPRGSQSRSFDFVERNLIFAWPAANYFRADIVQNIRIVLDSLCTLVGCWAWMSKALSERRCFWSATCQTRCQEGDDDCCVAIEKAWHGDRRPLKSVSAEAKKSAGEYSGRRPNRPSGIDAEISGQIHVEKDCLILRHDFDVASRRGDECGGATMQTALSIAGLN